VLKYAPVDANVSVGFSLIFHSVVIVYWTLRRPIVSLLPPPLYALSVGGIPVLITILAANIPILQKVLEKVRIKRVESLLSWAMGICVIILLFSAFLPWRITYSRIYEGRVDTFYENFHDLFYFKIPDKAFLSPSEIIMIKSFLLTLFIGATPVEIEMRKENLRGRVLLLRSLLFGVLCIVSVSSWIYEIERVRIELINPDYIAYHIESLAIISGLSIIFFGYSYIKMKTREKDPVKYDF